MFNLSEIVNGWKNYIVDDPISNERAIERSEKCLKCNHRKYGSILAILKDYSIKEIQGTYCELCGCPLSAKLRSEKSKCDIKLW